MWKKIIFWTVVICAILYIGLCYYFYLEQEKYIFEPRELPRSYQYQFNKPFEEVTFKMEDENILNGLIFKAENSKGLVFFVHGNAGNNETWNGISTNYTQYGYDILIFDYRGYGKSQGQITSEQQFYEDIQNVYNQIKNRYDEKNIIIVGYSIGTAAATRLAALNKPRMLILQAPYYSMAALKDQYAKSIIPDLILRYEFDTAEFLEEVKVPIYIFHGEDDEAIAYNKSVKLKQKLKPGDKFITLKNQGHGGIDANEVYKENLKSILGPK